MIDTQGRVLLSRALSPISKKLPRLISPNIATIAGLVFGFFCIFSIIVNFKLLAFLFFLLNRIADAFDGNIARNSNRETKIGSIFDITSDFIIYASVPIAIAIHSGQRTELIVTCILLATYYINAGIWMSISQVTSPESRGIIEGFETAIFYLAMILFQNYFVQIGSIFALLVGLTISLRLIRLFRKAI